MPKAKSMAKANGIKPAVSNPSFELWLLVHFREPPGMSDRHKLKEMLKEFIPDYDKSVVFSVYADGYKKAVSRSRRMNKQQSDCKTLGGNPSTNVF